MIDPPIEELKNKVGNAFVLSNLVAKRAKELEKEIPEVIENSLKKSISLAMDEIYSGKIVASKLGAEDTITNKPAKPADDTKKSKTAKKTPAKEEN